MSSLEFQYATGCDNTDTSEYQGKLLLVWFASELQGGPPGNRQLGSFCHAAIANFTF